MKPQISVIIPVYNNACHLKKTLLSLKHQSFKNFETIVIDDASQDNSAQIARKFTPKVIVNEKNLGPAKSRNKAIKTAKGEIIAFIDSDCLANKNWLKVLVKKFKKNQVGVIMGKIKIPKSTLLGDCISALGFPGGGSVGFENMWPVSKRGYTAHLSACNFAAQQEIFKKHGLFNETFPFPGGEDSEFSFRLTQKNIKIKYCPEAIVYHQPRKNLISFAKWMFFRGKSNYYLKKKIGKIRNLIWLRIWSTKNIIQKFFFNPKLILIIPLLFLSFVLQQLGYLWEFWHQANKHEALAKLYFLFFLLIILSKAVLSQQALISPYGNHYYFLSQSFLKGKLDVTEQIKTNFTTSPELKKAFDYAIFKDQYFVPMGAFPAVIGIPFLILGPERHLTALVAFFLILTVYFLTKFVRFFLKNEAFLTALLLIIASPLLTTLVFKGPWYLAGLISAYLGFWFLWLYVIKKKEWGMLFIIPLVLTRPTTIFYFLIPLVDILKKGIKKEGRKTLILSTSVTLSLILFFAYNWLRFGDIFEPGYRYQAVPTTEFRRARYQKEASIKDYFVSNTIYMFFNPPRVYLNEALRFVFPYFELSRYGVGLIFTIPWFLLYFFGHSRKRRDWPYLLTTGTILLATLSFPGEGSFQIGPRYACDFLPLIVFLNLRWLGKKREKIPLFQKLLLLSFVLNTYFYLLVLLGHIRRV